MSVIRNDKKKNRKNSWRQAASNELTQERLVCTADDRAGTSGLLKPTGAQIIPLHALDFGHETIMFSVSHQQDFDLVLF